MKNILFLVALYASFITYGQTQSYNDLGVLFSTENIDGTARYNAMSGAFGSLGGDISAIESNPAGAAVFLKSEVSFSLDFNGVDTKATYYGESTFTDNDNVKFSQAGGVFVFNTNYAANNNGWKKLAFAFNYTTANNYENFWVALGNSNYPSQIYDPINDKPKYIFSEGQYFENYTDGRNNKYTFTFASNYQDKIYVGASLISYDVDFYQNIFLEEYNDDGKGDLMDASLIQDLYTYGNGFSFNLGIIGKPSKNIRLGLAYQSPIWYNLGETFYDYGWEYYVYDLDEYFQEPDYPQETNYYYNLRTPSKYTGSFSYIFNKFGLISLDYIYKNFSNIKLSDGYWTNENQAFKNELNGVSEVRVGTEWRIKKASIRGGYHFEQTPYKDAISSDNKDGFSLGLGYNFGFIKFDVSYQQDRYTAPYAIYPQYPEVSATELDYKFSKVTATLVFNI